ncbi:hypothetical protein [Nocardia carnea]|uniref:hypothetical protein n=1 Tax=Nocardia carnea TaxID=37328 RepID=UPI002456D206|nr:hypothetical protein [Nocardia carnea]
MAAPEDESACYATGMDTALGRYDELIDVRNSDTFNAWRNTPGLRCLVCRHPVEAYHSSRQRPYVRHGKGHAATGSPRQRKTADETFLHFKLKYWVCAELQVHGSSDAHVETRLERRTPDVFGHIDGRGYAVEVQWSPLAHAEALARTRDLLAAGADEVLWLTRTCAWAEKLPVLGVKSFRVAGDDYEAHTGYLAHRPRLGLRPAPISIRHALRSWTAGELVWAHQDHKKAGWATVTDWKLHTRAQADEILQRKRQLSAALTERDNLKRQLQHAQAAIDDNAGALDHQAAVIDQLHERSRRLDERISRLDETLQQTQQDKEAEQRRRLAADQALAEQEQQVSRLRAALQGRMVVISLLCILCGILLLAVLLI